MNATRCMKMTSLKTGEYHIFLSGCNLAKVTQNKQSTYNRWRRCKHRNPYYKYFEIMKHGNFKIEYISEEEYDELKDRIRHHKSETVEAK